MTVVLEGVPAVGMLPVADLLLNAEHLDHVAVHGKRPAFVVPRRTRIQANQLVFEINLIQAKGTQFPEPVAYAIRDDEDRPQMPSAARSRAQRTA